MTTSKAERRATPRPPIPSKGSQALAAWLDGPGRSQVKLAELIGVHQTSVSGWIGESVPSLLQAVKLEEITGIPVGDWTEAPSSSPEDTGRRRAVHVEPTGTDPHTG